MTDDRTTESDAPDQVERSEAPKDDAPRGDGMEGCPRCAMKVRRSEMSIHLAHAHNIGPAGDRKRRGGRGGGRDRR